MFSLEMRETDNWKQKGLDVMQLSFVATFSQSSWNVVFHDREVYLDDYYTRRHRMWFTSYEEMKAALGSLFGSGLISGRVGYQRVKAGKPGGIKKKVKWKRCG